MWQSIIFIISKLLSLRFVSKVAKSFLTASAKLSLTAASPRELLSRHRFFIEEFQNSKLLSLFASKVAKSFLTASAKLSLTAAVTAQVSDHFEIFIGFAFNLNLCFTGYFILKSQRRSRCKHAKTLTAVGFEPTQLALVELESTPLDHSGKLSCCA